MNNLPRCENRCKTPAVWRAKGTQLHFCERCKEEIIVFKGVDAYEWERLANDPGDNWSGQSMETREFREPPGSHVGRRKRWQAWAARRHKEKPKKPRLRQPDADGILRIFDRKNPRLWRWVCTTMAAWEMMRRIVYERDGGRCRRCGDLAPLHGRVLAEIEPGLPPTVQRAGQAMHVNARKMGGGFRDDHPDNLVWGCSECHRLDPTCKFLQPQREREGTYPFNSLGG